MRVLGKGLDEGVDLDKADSDAEEFEDAEEDVEEVFDGFKIRVQPACPLQVARDLL